jgi:flavin-dependent dehydrogenase
VRRSRGAIVIVGAGPAGATAALAIARAEPALAGRVLLVERARFPRDKPCAGALAGRGEAILARLGVEPLVPAVPVHGLSFAAGGDTVAARPGGRIGSVVRRLELDHALARAAVAGGATLLEETTVRAVTGRGAGARVETDRGALEAALVIGADGVGSVVRRAIGGGPGALRARVLEVDTAPAGGDPARDLLHFDASDRDLIGYTWDFPTVVDGEPLVSRGIYHLPLDGRSIDLEARLSARLAARGIDLDRSRRKRFAERGFEPAMRIADGSMLLTGEAAGIDPVSGEGIAQAIEYGALCGRFVADVVAGRRSTWEWPRVVEGSRLGRDLRARHAALRWFYGPHRRRVERLLLGCPSILHVAGEHFAARRWSAAHVARMAAALLGAGLRRDQGAGVGTNVALRT